MLAIDHLRKNYGAFRLDCTLSVKPGIYHRSRGAERFGKKHYL